MARADQTDVGRHQSSTRSVRHAYRKTHDAQAANPPEALKLNPLMVPVASPYLSGTNDDPEHAGSRSIGKTAYFSREETPSLS